MLQINAKRVQPVEYSETCMAAYDAYHEWLDEDVEERGAFTAYDQEPRFDVGEIRVGVRFNGQSYVTVDDWFLLGASHLIAGAGAAMIVAMTI